MTKPYQNLLLTLISLLIGIVATAQTAWNPNAGVVTSYTKMAGAGVTVSSGENVAAIIDNNIQSYWRSDASFPDGYYSKSINILRNLGGTTQCTNSGGVNCTAVTDVSNGSSVTIPSTNNGTSTNTWLRFTFNTAKPFYCLSLKMQTDKPVQIYLFKTNNDSILLGTYQPWDNLNTVRFVNSQSNIKSIQLRTANYFTTLYEIAALSAPPTERATIDLGAIRNVGWIETRHFSGNVVASARVFVSADNLLWTQVGTINPSTQVPISTILNPVRNIRYIRFTFTMAATDWGKAQLWEVDAYNSKGMYGDVPPAQIEQSTVSNFLGVNGEWGWGWFAGSDVLQPGQGAYLYNQVAQKARNFHNMSWDIYDPDDTPNYAMMEGGGGTNVFNWLNWNTEYGIWKNAGMEIDACITFANATQPQDTWTNPYESAYNYGYTFANHFGSAGDNLVKMVEIGNEPWDYDATFYQEVLRGMAQGIKAADPNMKVIPAAFQAGFPEQENTNTRNYMGARITPEAASLIDGLNVHYYSYMWQPNGTRISVHPEHPQSALRTVLNDLRFRNANMPNKPIYITELGWDSAASGAEETCTHSECVAEDAQAAYAVRSTFWLMRLGIERAYWFNFANSMGGSTWFSRAGLTSSLYNGFAPKKSFKAWQSLQQLMGDKKFLGVLQESNSAYIYVFGNANNTPTHIVAWRPVSFSTTGNLTISIPYTIAPQNAWIVDGNTIGGTPTNLPVFNGSTMNISVSTKPVVIKLNTNGGKTEISTPNSQLLLYPNPTDEAANLILNYALSGNAQVTIYNALGQIMDTQKTSYQAGGYALVLSTANLSNGIYWVKVAALHEDNSQQTETIKMVVLKP
ncbi:MAG: T9SS type A sorting domain-containing protein [Chitinophagales bacterium]|nr:T9SS type A sorting domain-containing protein [Chitinophagales bacterium]